MRRCLVTQIVYLSLVKEFAHFFREEVLEMAERTAAAALAVCALAVICCALSMRDHARPMEMGARVAPVRPLFHPVPARARYERVSGTNSAIALQSRVWGTDTRCPTVGTLFLR